jgi:hypothetical protein
LRYPLVGGTRQRHFAGTNFEPSKLLENAQTPTSRVHAVLGAVCWFGTFAFINTIANKDITKIFSLICLDCPNDAVNYKCKVSKGHQEHTYDYRKKDSTA